MKEKELQNTPAVEAEEQVEKSEIIEDTAAGGNFNDNLHGENLTDRAKVLSPAMTVIKRFFRSKLSIIGLVTIIFLFAFSFLGPLFSPWSDGGDGTKKDYVNKNPETFYTSVTYTDPATGEKYEAWEVVINDSREYNTLGGISAEHWLGTDDMGNDVFTNLMYGGRISLTIGFVVVILETLLGVLLGGLAGYFGKWVDTLIMRIVDILSCIPSLPIMLILGLVFDSWGLQGNIMKLYYMMAVLCLLGWTGTARLVRGQILSLREQDFMLAAKGSGLSTGKKIFKHLIPNIVPQLIVSMTLGLGSVILMEATLGFLGIGASMTTATWGNMINATNNSRYRNFFPNLWLGSGVCITLAILAFNFVGDGLRDAFDPKMKR